jgi:hypothetical protein
MDWTTRGSNSGGGEILRTCPDRSWAHPASCTMGTRYISRGQTGWGVALATNPHLASRLKKSRAASLLPLCAIMAAYRVYLPSILLPWNFTSEILFGFLGAVAKFRKTAITFVMSLRLSLRMQQVFSHWTDFDKIAYFRLFFFFRNYVEKIHVSLKSDKNNRYFSWRRFCIRDNISMVYS